MIDWTVPTMTCGHCVATVTRTVQRVDPAAKVDIELAQHRVRIDTVRDAQAIRAALAEEGYAPAA